MTSIIRTEYAACQALKREENESFNLGGCAVDFDKSLCWASARLGQQLTRDCPFKYCTTIPGCEEIKEKYMVSRNCNNEGVWQDTNYTMCIKVVDEYAQCLHGFCRACPDVMRDLVISVTITLSIVSVILLVAAIILFSIFDSIQCRRLSIHKNLATAFVFRFAIFAIWTIVQSTNLFNDCSRFIPTPLWELDWVCKAILWLVIYFQVASFMWMLIEGAFLYSRFTVFAMRHNDAPWSLYLACGWGFPFAVVSAWTAVHQYQSPNSFCWLPYAQGNHLWILSGTMGAALIMNLIFLLMIVVILVQKLRTENSAESKKIWRTIKATLLLVPLLGISNIPLFYEPEHRSSVYMLVSAFLQHSQGIFIAVLYCFLNSEIQGALKRQLSKVPFEFFKPRNRFETERTYVPENRNATKNGVPMEELNGTKKLDNSDNTESQDQSNSTNKQIYSVTTKA